MMRTITAACALERLGDFDAVIDARSEGEFALDHLPRAQNWPSLNDAERHTVGTLYAQDGAFEAHKRGAALVAANIAGHIDTHLAGKPKNWRPLVYCWRGGKRSGALALVLSQIGFQVSVIEGGYKAFRAAMLASLPRAVAPLTFRVVCGPTGSGKTRLLGALAAVGAQVLDLEALANHRSSVLGLIPGQPQPTQKRFDTLVWSVLNSFDPMRPVFVESESKKVGNVAVPDALMVAMRASQCLDLRLSEDERVELLLEDYRFFIDQPELFRERLDALVSLRGNETVRSWQESIARGEFRNVVRELLASHYDPGYLESMRRNFSGYADAQQVLPADRQTSSMTALALEIVSRHDAAAFDRDPGALSGDRASENARSTGLGMARTPQDCEVVSPVMDCGAVDASPASATVSPGS